MNQPVYFEPAPPPPGQAGAAFLGLVARTIGLVLIGAGAWFLFMIFQNVRGVLESGEGFGKLIDAFDKAVGLKNWSPTVLNQEIPAGKFAMLLVIFAWYSLWCRIAILFLTSGKDLVFARSADARR
jgi:hypothetical protein